MENPIIKIRGEFYLHTALHLVGSYLKHLFKYIRQRECVIAQYMGKCHSLRSLCHGRIYYASVLVVIGRSDL